MLDTLNNGREYVLSNQIKRLLSRIVALVMIRLLWKRRSPCPSHPISSEPRSDERPLGESQRNIDHTGSRQDVSQRAHGAEIEQVRRVIPDRHRLAVFVQVEDNITRQGLTKRPCSTHATRAS